MWICAYCRKALTEKSQLTSDHVLARSWYPGDTPAVEKWQVPACHECNSRYSRMEDDVLTRLALCLDPEKPELKKIIESALRSMDPREGRNAADAWRRLRRKWTMRNEARDIWNPEMRGLLPSFRNNFYKGSRKGILISADALRAVVQKWIYGIHLCELGEAVPEQAEVSTYFVDHSVEEESFAEIASHAKIIQKGPGVEVAIWHRKEGDYAITLYAFHIWQSFKAYGSVEIGEKPEPSAIVAR